MIFSSKKKVTVNLTVQQLFEPSQIPDSARQGVVKGILNDGNLVNFMLEEISGSIPVRANSALNWAKKNDYYFGVPGAQFKSNIDAKETVMSVIATNSGQSITPVYYTMGPMNSFHYAWVWLANTYGYVPETNELVGIRGDQGQKCYVKNMVATYTKESYDFMQESHDMGMVAQMGPPPNSGYTPSNPFTALKALGIGEYNKEPAYEVSAVAVEDYVTITYEYEQSPGVFVVRGLTLSLSGVDLTADFHQCRFKRADGKTGFFTYQQGSGTYPIIDMVFTLGFKELGTYFPWVYFRVNNERVFEMFDIKAYEDAKKFASYLGVNYDILDAKVDEDPNVLDVAQSMLMLGVNPGDKDPYCIEYLYKHFNVMFQNGVPAPDKANTLGEQFHAFTSSPSQVQVIQDKFFAQSLQYSGITRLRKPGKIGAVGEYTSQYMTVDQGEAAILLNGPTGVATAVAPNLQPAWVYRFQVNDSMYEEISVFGLRAFYNIHRKKGYGAGAQDPKLLIPLDRETLRTMSMRGKEKVICRAMHFFVSTVIITQTPWYASGAFKIVMLIVAVVITIISAGSAWQSIVAVAALGATALAITVLSYIVTALAIQYGVKLFVQKFGPQIGIIAAIAALAVGAYGATTNATWGETLIGLSTNLANQSTNAFQDIIGDIMTDIQNFEMFAKGAFDDLADAKAQLGLDQQYVGLEPLEIVHRVPEIRLGESPNDMYNRTVHSGNIGVIAYDLIENFVDTRLTLPTLADNQQEETDDGMAI